MLLFKVYECTLDKKLNMTLKIEYDTNEKVNMIKGCLLSLNPLH